MKKFIILPVLFVFGFALFSCTCCTSKKGETMKGETTGEYIDDATMTTKVSALIVKDTDAHLFKIDVTTVQGDVVLQGFVNSKDTEERLVTKIKEIRGVKSVKSLLRIEEKK
jgi:hyperosmotically inducible protein